MQCWTIHRVPGLVFACLACHADAGRPIEAAPPAADVRPATQAPLAVEPDPTVEACPELADLEVLFIGNSYLNLHDLPLRLSQMGEDAGIRIGVDKVTMGGENFEYHLRRPKTTKLLRAREWDMVVLQSHSLDPLRNPEGFLSAGAELGVRVREQGAEPLLFETWPRRAGHNVYNYFKPAGGNPEAMQLAVSDRYAQLADAENMRVVPVGQAWSKVMQQHPEIDLFAKDGGHPSIAGAYLGACVVFSVLTQHSPVAGDDASRGVSEADAETLRAVASKVVNPRCGPPA